MLEKVCHFCWKKNLVNSLQICCLSVKHDAIIVMQEASDAHSKTADSDTVSTYQVSSVQLVTDKKLEAAITFGPPSLSNTLDDQMRPTKRRLQRARSKSGLG